MPGSTRGGKKSKFRDADVAPIFLRRGGDEAQDGGAGRMQRPSLDQADPLMDAQPASRADITQVLAKMGDMQAFLGTEMAKLAAEVRTELGALGTRTAALEEMAEEVIEAHNVVARGSARMGDRVARLELALEDMSNRSRRNNIRLRGLPESVPVADLHDTVLGIFKRLAPDIPPATLLLDRVHRALRAPRADGTQPRDVVLRLHYYTAKEEIMRKSRNVDVEYEGAKLALYQDIAPETLQRRRNWRPVTSHLTQHNIRYAWGFPFKLLAFVGDKTSVLMPHSDPSRFFARLDCPPMDDADAFFAPPTPVPTLTPRWENVRRRSRGSEGRSPD